MTELLTDDEKGICRAADLLRCGKLVAFGTETVYGLGADASDASAVAAIYAAKNRPAFNPLISHFPDAHSAFRHVIPSPQALKLAECFWPGPLTLVLPVSPDSLICDLARAGLNTAAVRVPSLPGVQMLLRQTDRPIAAPSANPSGGISPSTAEHVMKGLNGRIAAVLDTGPCDVGLESTIIDLSGEQPRLLRAGGISVEKIVAAIGPVLMGDENVETSAPIAPGQLSSHYAPDLPIRLNATSVGPKEALLAFGLPLKGSPLVWNLSETESLEEAASRLFSGLHHLDHEGRKEELQGIAVQPIPKHGLGLAIHDRLSRAAAPRPKVVS